MFPNKLYKTRTVVPNAGGLTDFIAGSSILTRIVSAAAIGARDFIETWRLAAVNLMKKFISIGF